MSAEPTPARWDSGETASGPSPSTGCSSTQARLHTTYPTICPSTSATIDNDGSHSSVRRSASTSVTSTGVAPGRAWSAKAAATTPLTPSTSSGRSRRISTLRLCRTVSNRFSDFVATLNHRCMIVARGGGGDHGDHGDDGADEGSARDRVEPVVVGGRDDDERCHDRVGDGGHADPGTAG